MPSSRLWRERQSPGPGLSGCFQNQALWSERLRRNREVAPRSFGRRLRLRQGRTKPLPQKARPTNQASDSAQTYVLADDLVVKGYYSLAAGTVSHQEATE